VFPARRTRASNQAFLGKYSFIRMAAEFPMINPRLGRYQLLPFSRKSLSNSLSKDLRITIVRDSSSSFSSSKYLGMIIVDASIMELHAIIPFANQSQESSREFQLVFERKFADPMRSHEIISNLRVKDCHFRGDFSGAARDHPATLCSSWTLLSVPRCKLLVNPNLDGITQAAVYKLQTIEKLIAYPSVRYRTRNFPNRGADNRRGRLALRVTSCRAIFSRDASYSRLTANAVSFSSLKTFFRDYLRQFACRTRRKLLAGYHGASFSDPEALLRH